MANEKFNAIKGGRKVVISAGAAVQISGSNAGIKCQKVTIMAETDNTSAVVVGGPNVVATLSARTGIPLSPGQSFTFGIENLNAVWLDVEAGGDGVTYVYFD